ncbi:hypothetical protein SNE40_020371 [Patella caerulea]|uniref:Uncharacterized protein n=1 Tax=Patella caerulea TaxID=87958 RepID=A0AAN8G7E3_PATCE
MTTRLAFKSLILGDASTGCQFLEAVMMLIPKSCLTEICAEGFLAESCLTEIQIIGNRSQAMLTLSLKFWSKMTTRLAFKSLILGDASIGCQFLEAVMMLIPKSCLIEICAEGFLVESCLTETG